MTKSGSPSANSPRCRRDLASMLQQKTRLAALGLAVSKINHDLRNLLASAQLFSDRLVKLPDPQVQRFAPKLMQALERAIDFCQSTLSYGRAQEPAPDRRAVMLRDLVDEVRDTIGLSPESPIAWITAVDRGVTVDADREQLLRVLVNLARNAAPGARERARRMTRPATRSASPGGGRARSPSSRCPTPVPASPEGARAHLFEAFQGSTRTGGAGLGLAIAAELVRAHGGEIDLVDGTLGATSASASPTARSSSTPGAASAPAPERSRRRVQRAACAWRTGHVLPKPTERL